MILAHSDLIEYPLEEAQPAPPPGTEPRWSAWPAPPRRWARFRRLCGWLSWAHEMRGMAAVQRDIAMVSLALAIVAVSLPWRVS